MTQVCTALQLCTFIHRTPALMPRTYFLKMSGS